MRDHTGDDEGVAEEQAGSWAEDAEELLQKIGAFRDMAKDIVREGAVEGGVGEVDRASETSHCLKWTTPSSADAAAT